MKNKSIKRVCSVALFSTILSVGIGIIPSVNQSVVYAQELNDYSVSSQYKDSGIKNVLQGQTFIVETGSKFRYSPVVQKVDSDKSLYIDINDDLFKGEGEDVNYWYILATNYLIKHDFKQGEELTFTQTIKDPLKLKNLANYESMRDFRLDLLKRVSFFFFDENQSNTAIQTPKDLDFSVNKDNTELTVTYHVIVPKDNPYMRPELNFQFLGERGNVSKAEGNYSTLVDALRDKDVVDVASSEVIITNKNGEEIVEPLSLGKVRATKDSKIAKNGMKAYYAQAGVAYPNKEISPKVDSDQSIKANVLNGGITGGIVSTEVGENLAIKDVDFGELSIGKVIEPIKEDSMVSVRDWTGGNGWKLTAKHKNADRNQSLQLGVQVNENSKVELSNEAQPVTSGESQLETITQGGTYTAEWGTHPTVGEFNNVIEWNLTANVTE